MTPIEVASLIGVGLTVLASLVISWRLRRRSGPEAVSWEAIAHVLSEYSAQMVAARARIQELESEVVRLHVKMSKTVPQPKPPSE